MDGRKADREVAARIGRNVWLARRRVGYSQEGLGALCSLHRTEIGMIESGQRLPRADTLLKLAGALGARPDRLLEGIEWIVPGPSSKGSFAVRRKG
jgi:transcriptional regulator with XRE-family HTH domain